jgi:hypothetical protein
MEQKNKISSKNCENRLTHGRLFNLNIANKSPKQTRRGREAALPGSRRIAAGIFPEAM